MFTIFDGIQKMNEEQLRHEIAIMRCVNPGEFAKTSAQKAKQSSIQLANKVTSLFGKTLSDSGVLEMDGKVALEEDNLRGMGRFELLDTMRMELCKVLEDAGVKEAATMSDEKISVLAISKAGESVDGVPFCMTTLNKAEAVADKNLKQDVNDFESSISKSKLAKQILAQFVQVAVRAYDEKLAPVLKGMPSFRTGDELEVYLAKEKEAHNALDGMEAAKKECEKLENEIKISADRAMTQKSRLQGLAEKEEYLQDKSDSDDPETLLKVLEETRSRMQECKTKQKEFEEDYYAKQVELELVKQKYENAEVPMNALVEEHKEALAQKWAKAFAKCDFKEGVVESVIRSFYYQELLALEEALTELCMAQKAEDMDDDPTDDEKYFVFRFMTETGRAGRIAFHVKEDRILILQIQKSVMKKA